MELAVLTERYGREREVPGVYLWDPLKEGLEAAVKSLLTLYDQVLLILSKPPLGTHTPLAEHLVRENPRRLLLYPTSLFGPGLEALAERAGELAKSLDVPALLQELERTEREGRLYLASASPEHLRALGWLPPAGGMVLGLGFWALFALEGEALRLPPLPVPEGRLPGVLAGLWGGQYPGRRVRVHLAMGDVPQTWRKELPERLQASLRLERGRVVAPGEDLRGRLGPKTLVGFAYPL